MLTEQHKEQAKQYISNYLTLRTSLEELQKVIDTLQAQSQKAISTLDEMRESEKQWTKESAAELQITEMEFVNLCNQYITAEYKN